MQVRTSVETEALDMALRSLTQVQQGALVRAPGEHQQDDTVKFVVRGLSTTIAVLVEARAAVWEMAEITDIKGQVVTGRVRAVLTEFGIALRQRLEEIKPESWLKDAHDQEREA